MDLPRWKALCAAVVLLLAGGACRQREEAAKAAAPEATAVAPEPKAVEASASNPVARGRYLAEAVLGCVSCHTERDVSRYAGPLRGAALAGACYGKEWGLPGRVCAPNLTSDPEHGIGRWTDAELLRAIREGYGRDGRTLFPMMPYTEWRTLSDEDARAVVAYLRQVPPVPHSVPRTELPAEVLAGIASLASALPGPVPAPGSGELARGRYLATVAQCAFCHGGAGEPSEPFAGGLPVPTPYGEEKAPGLLPHGAVLRGMSEDAFVARFTAWREPAAAPSVQGRINKLAMPWLSFARMRDEDLRALYRYLQTLPTPARQGG
ncbi:c-type cytochrome [Pyxidicoccus xibeiensis]|uniref:c-type cytochrome n=1 Tax=Pyxidicoccus xibeiensis TaxID=2906759 RepID=UPI0020A799FB|nr:c-type cytochrome [Pyxidicoccus xibeiensis]MCP3138668.1 cytochrome c [Pyxidicoccus xibeiensis]